MKCKKHEIMVVMDAFADTNCQECNCHITTAHMPGDVVCVRCSDLTGYCRVCGEEVKD